MTLRFNPLTGSFDFDTKTWVKFSDHVTNGTTKAIDTIALSDFNGASYEITVYNRTQSVARTFKITINNANGALKDIVSGRIGTPIDYKIDAIVNAGNMELELTNNELYGLDVSVARLIL